MPKTYDELLDLFASRGVEYLSVYENINLPIGSLIHITPAGKIVNFDGKALSKRKVWEGEVQHKLDEKLNYYVPVRVSF